MLITAASSLAAVSLGGCVNVAVEETRELEALFNEVLGADIGGGAGRRLRAAVEERADYDGMVRAFFSDLAEFIVAVEERERELESAELGATLLQGRLGAEDPRAAQAAGAALFEDRSAAAEEEFARRSEELIPAILYGSQELRRFADWEPDPRGAVGQLLEQFTLEGLLLFPDPPDGDL